MYADKVYGLFVENCLFDRNGGQGSMFNHGLYCTGLSRNLVITGSTFANSSNYGVQARCGGDITGEKVPDKPVGVAVGVVKRAGGGKDRGGPCPRPTQTI